MSYEHNWGRVDLALASSSARTSGSGELARVVLRLLDNAPAGFSGVQITDATWYRADFSSGDPDPSPQAGTLTVGTTGPSTSSGGGNGGGGDGGGCFFDVLRLNGRER